MTRTVLVLGGTGKTGRRITALLRADGLDVRTAARSGADVPFTWADPATHAAALAGVDRVYLVPPAFDLDFAAPVLGFLDLAQSTGVRHVTYLSAGGVEFAPPEAAMRAVELDLIARDDLTHTILRPAWFMQNFTEGAFADSSRTGVLSVPAGDGAEAFVDAQDIAAAAAASLLKPSLHAGREYALTGPEALTHADIAAELTAHGRPVIYQPVPDSEWVAAGIAAGLPAPYAGFLATLLEIIRAGNGTRPNDAVEQATGRPPTSFAAMLTREL